MNKIASRFLYSVHAGLCFYASIAWSGPTRIELTTNPVITIEYHGANRGRGATEFSLRLAANGTVIFEGRYRTRITGQAKSKVDQEKVERWTQLLVKDGALDRSDSPLELDVAWYLLTINSNGKINTFRFNGTNKHNATVSVVSEIFEEVQVFERWVIAK